jgi:hypothetical protein
VDRHAELRNFAELEGVVLSGPDRLREVLSDLRHVDVESGREDHVADVVATEVHVHEPGHEVGWVRVTVVLDSLDEGRGAVADADDADAHLGAALGA